ncbi:hypothetical protein ACFROC_06320 [Nocardia tengchongensis]|uniref:WXG100-like domain-containing protein n=1 Tax=Nocardia tengchongensis TaxID=2055889 RepID=UPI0036D18BA7
MSPPPTVPLIICRAGEYSSAGDVFATIGTDAVDTHSGLLGVLRANTGMAGSDSIGQEWSTAYNQAATSALQASSQLAAAAAQVHDLIVVGAYNHQAGESAADHNNVDPPPPPALTPPSCLPDEAPSAAGEGIPEPFGWSVIKDAVGAMWPNGHQSELLAAQSAWSTAAANFHTMAGAVPQAIDLLTNQQSEEIPAAVEAARSRQSDLNDLGAISTEIATACGDYAHHLDEAHHQILEELKDLGLETAAVELGLAVLAPVTAGLSEYIGNSAWAARIAVKAARIASIIVGLATKARESARLVGTLAERVQALASKIAQWVQAASARLAVFGRRTGSVPKLKTTPMNPHYKGESLPGNPIWPGQSVRYLTPEERQSFQLFIRDGKFYDAQGTLFDTTASTTHFNDGRAIFVMDENGALYASKFHAPGEFHHSSFLSGAPVAGAGEIEVTNGELRFLTDSSGHYRPAQKFSTQVIDQLRSEGLRIDPSQIDLRAPK